MLECDCQLPGEANYSTRLRRTSTTAFCKIKGLAVLALYAGSIPAVLSFAECSEVNSFVLTHGVPLRPYNPMTP